MELFDLIKVMYKNSGEYDRVPDAIKTKHMFMINRLHSIAYPIQANMFNRPKINESGVVDYWQRELGPKFNSPPKWMFVKTSKSQKLTKKEYEPSEETVRYFCDRNQCSYRDLKELRNFIRIDIDKELKEIDSLFELSNKT